MVLALCERVVVASRAKQIVPVKKKKKKNEKVEKGKKEKRGTARKGL